MGRPVPRTPLCGASWCTPPHSSLCVSTHDTCDKKSMRSLDDAPLGARHSSVVPQAQCAISERSPTLSPHARYVTRVASSDPEGDRPRSGRGGLVQRTRRVASSDPERDRPRSGRGGLVQRARRRTGDDRRTPSVAKRWLRRKPTTRSKGRPQIERRATSSMRSPLPPTSSNLHRDAMTSARAPRQLAFQWINVAALREPSPLGKCRL